MKKLIVMAGALALGLAANAACFWSWWVGGRDADEKLHGCQLGIASECKEIQGAQVSLLWNRVEAVRGGCQFAFGYNNAGKVLNGPQLGMVNISREGSALQFGLLNWNKGGFLPFFVFFNFNTAMFGDKNK